MKEMLFLSVLALVFTMGAMYFVDQAISGVIHDVINPATLSY